MTYFLDEEALTLDSHPEKCLSLFILNTLRYNCCYKNTFPSKARKNDDEGIGGVEYNLNKTEDHYRSEMYVTYLGVLWPLLPLAPRVDRWLLVLPAPRAVRDCPGCRGYPTGRWLLQINGMGFSNTSNIENLNQTA